MLLSIDELANALRLRDLADPMQGPHAMQGLLDDVVNSLTTAWGCVTEVHRGRPLVSVEDNYDRLGYDPADVTRHARYTRYASPTVMLRSHTTAGIPPALRRLAERHRDLSSPLMREQGDVLLIVPGLYYRP